MKSLGQNLNLLKSAKSDSLSANPELYETNLHITTPMKPFPVKSDETIPCEARHSRLQQ
jgi:hypothetical protein